MDTNRLIFLFKATLDHLQRQQAEEELNQIHKIIGFCPSLLQVVMLNDLVLPVRQAAVIYLKREVESHWADKEGDGSHPQPFSIHEQDRALIRDSIVDAIVLAPDVIRAQLAQCINTIIKHDFPGRWTQVVDKISIYLQNPNMAGWSGVLLCLLQLVKIFEYKKGKDRKPLNEALNLLLPMTYQICVQLLPNPEEQSVALQKLILKIFFTLTQYVLPLDLISKEVFAQWMEICRQVVIRDVPAQTLDVDEESRSELPWWKCKKWAIHILYRCFERYGSPKKVLKEYNEFANWFLPTFSAGILEALLKVLDQYRQKIYISPRVIQLSLNYINQAVSHALSWKFLKPHMPLLTRDVLFPLLCYSDADQELWETDPYEYVRTKFDIFEDYVSPVSAAQTVLLTTCKKRKLMLQKTMLFVMEVLTSPVADAKQKDGALHMVGTLAEVLLKKENYRERMEEMLCTYVFPEFANPCGHMRARACWVLHYFSEIKFKADAILAKATELTVNVLLHDSEVPVKVEAAIALQMLLRKQPKVEHLIAPQIKTITMELLQIIRKTENDDLTTVMQKIVSTYYEELMPIAVEICDHLAGSFKCVIESDESSDEKALVAMGLLNTVETLLSVMENNTDIMNRLQPIVLTIVGNIFNNRIAEYYEEALSLVYALTSKTISPEMWHVLELLYKVFESDGMDYFTDMIPTLHNYVTVDTPAFLSNQNHILAVYNMCKTVLTSGEAGEDPESHAAKLLEVIILQCKGQIDQCIPSFVELVLQRLMRELNTSELRTMCLQVVIAALYYNYQLLFEILEKIPMRPSMSDNGTIEPVTNHFIKQWINDTDCFLGLHDRKLCVLGLCQLISMTPNRPPILNELANKLIPSLILLFDGLKRAYIAKAHEDDENDTTTEDSDNDVDSLSSDEDDLDNSDYCETLEEKMAERDLAILDPNAPLDEEEEDGLYEDLEETALEMYTTPIDDDSSGIDEYVIFKDVLSNIQITDQAWYQQLVANLTTEQQKALGEVLTLADQRRAAAESKKILESGGYNFSNHTVPSSFNFGARSLGR